MPSNFAPLLNGGLDKSGRCEFRVADLAGLVDFVVSQAQICRREGFNLGSLKLGVSSPAMPSYLTPLLAGVIFVREPHLGPGFDKQRIALGAVDGAGGGNSVNDDFTWPSYRLTFRATVHKWKALA